MLLQSDEERGIRQIVSGGINHSVVLVIFAGLELTHYKTEKKLGRVVVNIFPQRDNWVSYRTGP